MRVRIAIAIALLLGDVAFAFTVNRQGTSTAPLSVSNSAVTLLPGATTRKSWCIWSETVSIRCNFGSSGGAAPTTTPTTTRGFLFNATTLYCANAGSNSNVPASVDPQARMDCISTGSASSVDTIETP